MSIEFHDPRAEPMAVPEPYTLRAAMSGPMVVGLLANGFPDSVAFLEAMEGALAERLPDASFKHYNKGNASIPVSQTMLDKITAECAAVIAAYGH